MRIVEACFVTLNDGTRQQDVRYCAPIESLIAAGLVTPAMVAGAGDGRRGPATTPHGCGYSLFLEPIDDAGLPGCADLAIFTGERPRERERFAVRDAVRELRRFMLPGRRGRRLAAGVA